MRKGHHATAWVQGGEALRDGRNERTDDGVGSSVGEHKSVLDQLGLHWSQYGALEPAMWHPTVPKSAPQLETAISMSGSHKTSEAAHMLVKITVCTSAPTTLPARALRATEAVVIENFMVRLNKSAMQRRSEE